MQNLNLLFNKTFYDEIGKMYSDKKAFEDDVKRKKKELLSAKFFKKDYLYYDAETDELNKNPLASNSFLMETAYPGLLVGTGYAHGVDIEPDIKVGFSFDYVTGQPYIPGSSVKGLLRSYFAYPAVIAELLGTALSDDIKAQPAEFIGKLEESIFGDKDTSSQTQDIFFDAVIRHGDENGHILGDDYITPHVSGVTKNPTPIQLIKILPKVVLEFSFVLHDSDIDGVIIDAQAKEKLFSAILAHFGIGAKTNVGYGVLTPVTYAKDKHYKWENIKEDKPAPAQKPAHKDFNAPGKNGALEVGGVYSCTVTGIIPARAFLSIDGTKKSGSVHISEVADAFVKDINAFLKVGDKVTAKILAIQPNGKIDMSIKKAK